MNRTSRIGCLVRPTMVLVPFILLLLFFVIVERLAYLHPAGVIKPFSARGMAVNSTVLPKLKSTVEEMPCSAPAKGNSFDCCGEFATVIRKTLDTTSKPEPSAPKEKRTKVRCWRILLIVVFNHPFYSVIPFIRRLYEPAFHKHIIFIGGQGSSPPHPEVKLYKFGKPPGKTMGQFQHVAIARAIADHPGYDGYVYTGDDVLVNAPRLLSVLDPLKMGTVSIEMKQSIYSTPNPKKSWYHWTTSHGLVQVRNALSCFPKKSLQRMKQALGCEMCILGTASDFGYVPKRYAYEFIRWMFFLRHTMNEISVPSASRLIPTSNDDIQDFSGTYLWLQQRERPFKLFKEDDVFLHPVKLSNKLFRQNVTNILSTSKLSVNATVLCKT